MSRRSTSLITALFLLMCFGNANAQVDNPKEASKPDLSHPQTIDLNDQADRQAIVDREKGKYLGHPTTCLLDDGKTILTV